MSRYLSPHPAPCQSKFPGDKTVASFHLGGTEAWSTLPKGKGEVCPQDLVASHMQWSGSAFLSVYMQVWRRLSLFSLPPLCECSITLLHSHSWASSTAPLTPLVPREATHRLRENQRSQAEGRQVQAMSQVSSAPRCRPSSSVQLCKPTASHLGR